MLQSLSAVTPTELEQCCHATRAASQKDQQSPIPVTEVLEGMQNNAQGTVGDNALGCPDKLFPADAATHVLMSAICFERDSWCISQMFYLVVRSSTPKVSASTMGSMAIMR